MALPYPNEPLPSHQLSLRDVNRLAQDAFGREEPHDIDHFLRVVLAGRDTINGELSYITLNARQGLPSLQDAGDIIQTRDIDSAVGVTNNIPFERATAFAVYPVPNFAHTLKIDNHLRAKAYMADVCFLFDVKFVDF